MSAAARALLAEFNAEVPATRRVLDVSPPTGSTGVPIRGR